MYHLCKAPTCALKENLNSCSCRAEIAENQTQNLILWLAELQHKLNSQPALTARGDPYHQLTEEEKTWAWFIDGSARSAGTTWNRTAAVLRPLSETSLKEQWTEVSPVGRTFSSAPGSFCLERLDVWFYWFMSCGQWFGCMGRNLEGT